MEQVIEASKYQYQPSWIMVAIVLSVVIFGYLFSAFHTRFITIMRAFLINRFTEQLLREEYSLFHPTSVFLSVNFLITSSLFILLSFAPQAGWNFIHLNFLSFLLLIGVIFSVYFLKILSLKLLGFIFDRQAVTNEYVFILFLVNQMIGLCFIPVVIFLAYGTVLVQAFIYVGILLFILMFLIRIGKGAIITLSKGEISLIHLFLYLCTLEILPLLLGWKLIEKLS